MDRRKETFRIRLLAFPGKTPEAASIALGKSFGITKEKAQQYIDRAPVAVKSNLSRANAQKVTKALLKIGADIEVQNDQSMV